MKTIVLLSGGLDSAVLAAKLVRDGHQVRGLSVDYGQRHRKEIDSAQAIARHLDIRWEIADLSSLKFFLKGSSQTSPHIDVPEGRYDDESMKATIVPNRNMLLISVAAAWGISTKADTIAYAAHAGDHAIYPDCRPEFVQKLSEAVSLADWNGLKLVAPFLHFTKSDIVSLGAKLGAELPMALSWSCYKGLTIHCGKCGTCVERREAFEQAGVPDPTKYET